MAEAPSSEHGEMTDKGYINQRAVLTRRADRVLEMYSDVPDAAVIFI
jgi:feruloyl-CoA synthase